MIGIITFNPAIDKRYHVESIALGQVQRAYEVENTAGGKGLNVLRVVKILGEEVIATGLLGGKSGEFIIEQLKKLNIQNRFQIISGETRCCLAIIDKDNNQTEFLEPGPVIQEQEFNSWLKIYEDMLNETSIVAASGSLPRGLKSDTYAKLILRAKEKGVKFFLDTSGEALIAGIKSKPFFVKPNLEELKAINNKGINSSEDIIEAIRQLNDNGIELVSVTLGKEGSITGYKGKLFEAILPEVQAVNSVGSGDSFVAGMAAAFERGMEIKDSIKFASACGCANAVEKRTGFVELTNIERLFNDIIMKELN
jgi:tagatose 6-phosphate kinase